MAFTSKVAFLLLVSVLAWAQAECTMQEWMNNVTAHIIVMNEEVTHITGVAEKNALAISGSRGESIAKGLSDIAKDISEGVAKLRKVSRELLADEEAKLVVKALATYVQFQKELLVLVKRAHERQSMSPYFKAIGYSLGLLKRAIGDLDNYLLVVIASQKSYVHSQFGSLYVSLDLCIVVYA
ncbi:unnamed protein product [Calypogeia fissa]